MRRSLPLVLLASSVRPARAQSRTMNASVEAAEGYLARYTDGADGARSWPRCIFQGLTNDPIDQFVFLLRGGRMRMADTLSPTCHMWANPGQKRSCPCTAPASLLGGNHTFVEIGANDGVHMSNSWFFEKHLGWRGMCVEANPAVYRRLKANRPNCMHVNALVGPAPTGNEPRGLPFLAFYRPEGVEKRSIERDWETGLSGIESADAPHFQIHSLHKAKEFAKASGLLVERTVLPVVPFARLFAQHHIRTIDFLSVDVEGAESRVLSSIDFDRVWVRMIATETTDANVTSLLRRNGFRDINVAFALGDRLWVNERPRRPEQIY